MLTRKETEFLFWLITLIGNLFLSSIMINALTFALFILHNYRLGI